MSGFHSHDDDFLYEVQRRDRKEPVPSRQTQRSPSMHRQAKAAGQAAMDAIVALAEQAEHAKERKDSCGPSTQYRVYAKGRRGTLGSESLFLAPRDTR